MLTNRGGDATGSTVLAPDAENGNDEMRPARRIVRSARWTSKKWRSSNLAGASSFSHGCLAWLRSHSALKGVVRLALIRHDDRQAARRNPVGPLYNFPSGTAESVTMFSEIDQPDRTSS
jgi:hypothetical protein